VLDDQPAEHDPDPPADAEDGRQDPDAAGDAVARELVADDPERQREDAAPGALDDAPGDHGPQRCRQGRNDSAERENPKCDEEQPLLAVHVAQAADDRRRHRRGEQVAGEQPRHSRFRGTQAVLDRRQRRDDRRAQHRVRQPGESGDAEDQVGVNPMIPMRLRCHAELL
jgi:hypothetical protein